MQPIRNWSRRIRFGLLNRFVLRPTTEPIDYRPQIRCRVPLAARSSHSKRGDSPWIECFVHRLGAAASWDIKEPGHLESWEAVKRPDDLVLKFPGTGGRAERSSPFPLQMNAESDRSAEVWTWNPPGYGNSPGKPSLKTFSEFAAAWSERVLAARAGKLENSKQTRVWLCGNSLGCLPAMHVAATLMADHPAAVLWVRNPPDLRRVILNISARWRATTAMQHVSAVLPRSVDAMDLAARCKLPAVFLMSEKDTLVLPEYQQGVHAAYVGQKHVVELSGLPHDGILDEDHRPVVEHALRWIRRQFPV